MFSLGGIEPQDNGQSRPDDTHFQKICRKYKPRRRLSTVESEKFRKDFG